MLGKHKLPDYEKSKPLHLQGYNTITLYSVQKGNELGSTACMHRGQSFRQTCRHHLDVIRVKY